MYDMKTIEGSKRKLVLRDLCLPAGHTAPQGGENIGRDESTWYKKLGENLVDLAVGVFMPWPK